MDLTLIERYNKLGITDVVDHEKFHMISIVHHSTVLEGSTLTEVETQVLIEEGLTPKGKPLSHSLMVTDHYTALQFALKEARSGRTLSIGLIQELNAMVMKNTGMVYHTMLGTVDGTKGEFRKGNVTAGNTYFPNFDKVAAMTGDMVNHIKGMVKDNLDLSEQVNLSFDAHYNLVSIHPFFDGNGRTSRLLMNYIQAYYQLPLAIVRQESKAEYIQALIDTRSREDINVFRTFMTDEYTKFLKDEINKYEKLQDPERGAGFTFLF